MAILAGCRFIHIKLANMPTLPLLYDNPLALCRSFFQRRKSHNNVGHQKAFGRILKDYLDVLSLSFGCQISSPITVVETSSRTMRGRTIWEEIRNRGNAASGICKGKATMRSCMKGSHRERDGETEAQIMQDEGRRKMWTLHFQLQKSNKNRKSSLILDLFLLHRLTLLPLIISLQPTFPSKMQIASLRLGLILPEASILPCLGQTGSIRMALL